MMQRANYTDCSLDLLNFYVEIFDKHQDLLLDLISTPLVVDVSQVLVVFFDGELQCFVVCG